MNNKLIKNLTITNIVLVCLVPVLAFIAIMFIGPWNKGEVSIGCIGVIVAIAIISAVFDFIKSNFGKKGNNFCKKLPACKTKIAYLVFGIVIVSCIVLAGLSILLYYLHVIRSDAGIVLPFVFGGIALLAGIGSLVTDSMAINEWRKK